MLVKKRCFFTRINKDGETEVFFILNSFPYRLLKRR